jgi:hypothetical protein
MDGHLLIVPFQSKARKETQMRNIFVVPKPAIG